MFALMALLPWAINSAASRCAPVPQSKIRRLPLAVVSSTQEGLPPNEFVPGPGAAIDPLVPQKRTLMSPLLPCVRHRSRKTILTTTGYIDCSLLLAVVAYLKFGHMADMQTAEAAIPLRGIPCRKRRARRTTPHMRLPEP